MPAEVANIEATESIKPRSRPYTCSDIVRLPRAAMIDATASTIDTQKSELIRNSPAAMSLIERFHGLMELDTQEHGERSYSGSAMSSASTIRCSPMSPSGHETGGCFSAQQLRRRMAGTLRRKQTGVCGPDGGSLHYPNDRTGLVARYLPTPDQKQMYEEACGLASVQA